MSNLMEHLKVYHTIDGLISVDDNPKLLKMTAYEFANEQNNTDFDCLKCQLIESDDIDELAIAIVLQDDELIKYHLRELKKLSKANLIELINDRLRAGE